MLLFVPSKIVTQLNPIPPKVVTHSEILSPSFILQLNNCVNVVVILVIKLDGTVPVKYGLRMNADDKHSVVKSKLSSLSGISANNLKLTEIIGAQIKVSCYC